MNKPHILIVEDDNEWQEIYRRCLSDALYEIISVRKVGEAISLLEIEHFDVVITDLKMLGGTEEFSGFGVLEQAKASNPDIQVIVITGFGSQDRAMRAMRNGAYDYITKDRDLRNKLTLTVEGALGIKSLKRKLLNEAQRGDVEPESNRIIGNSTSMQALFEQIARGVENDFNVLIQGEGGTGKHLIAQTIHMRSNKNGRFLVVDCGRLSDTVLEAELFGYEAGTIYSASESRAGKFEQASGGTIFLDGIGDLDTRLQPRLIGAICDRQVERIGGKEPIVVDARIIASTDKDLKAMSKKNLFDRRLFDALNEFIIQVPPLRQRNDGDDIPTLAAMFVKKYSKSDQVLFSPDAIELLKSYDYPGNIKELESIVKNALSMSSGNTIFPEHLRAELREIKDPLKQKAADERKNPLTILHTCPLNLGACTKKEEIVRLYSPRRVFVNIPYSNDFVENEKVIRETLEKYNLVPVVSKDHLEPGMLLCNVCKLLQSCKYGITDVSESGTNVFYELGLMHAIGIRCAILKDRRSQMMSDIGGLLFLEYLNPQSLREKLEMWIRTQIKEAIIPLESKDFRHIFISYRRSDSADIVGRIYDRMVDEFGRAAIFKDVDSIPLGINFKEYLDSKVSECTILLAIIGNHWLDASDANGKIRLEDPDDFVRIEIESALARGIPVIPLLVRGEQMPVEENLPISLRKLVYKNGIQIRPDPDFHRDMDRLISALNKYI
jgi:DNA-binding NtrC family response regulator